MKVKTQSGIVTGNKRSRYMQWLNGYVMAGGWTGQETIRQKWQIVMPNVSNMRCREAYLAGRMTARLSK